MATCLRFRLVVKTYVSHQLPPGFTLTSVRFLRRDSPFSLSFLAFYIDNLRELAPTFKVLEPEFRRVVEIRNAHAHRVPEVKA
jgi:hypothetical protein